MWKWLSRLADVIQLIVVASAAVAFVTTIFRFVSDWPIPLLAVAASVLICLLVWAVVGFLFIQDRIKLRTLVQTTPNEEMRYQQFKAEELRKFRERLQIDAFRNRLLLTGRSTVQRADDTEARLQQLRSQLVQLQTEGIALEQKLRMSEIIVPPGGSPMLARQLKIAQDYEMMNGWVSEVNESLQNIPGAGRYFMSCPESQSVVERMNCHTAKLSDILQDAVKILYRERRTAHDASAGRKPCVK